MNTSENLNVRTIWITYLALLVLLVTTVLCSFLSLGIGNLVLATLIAVAKAILVIWYFMELRENPELTGLFFGVSILMLIVATILAFTDFAMR